jgi:pimeloyl-ACP methyl ester carboxylesterase
VSGIRIRYADSGSSGERTVLLTCPWPESVYAFAPMWATLAEHARLFAIDLPGFGASERREDLLSPRGMGGFLAELIAEVDLGRPHIVAPDVGTSAALFLAAAHPESIASVIVGKPASRVGRGHRLHRERGRPNRRAGGSRGTGEAVGLLTCGTAYGRENS